MSVKLVEDCAVQLCQANLDTLQRFADESIICIFTEDQVRVHWGPGVLPSWSWSQLGWAKVFHHNVITEPETFCDIDGYK